MTLSLTLTRYALFKVLLVASISAHSHSFSQYSHQDHHLYSIVEVEIWTGKYWIKTFVMIYSGFSVNIIDSYFSVALNILFILKLQAIKYMMVDSKISATGIVIYDFNMEIIVSRHQELLTFDITKLHSYSIIYSQNHNFGRVPPQTDFWQSEIENPCFRLVLATQVQSIHC